MPKLVIGTSNNTVSPALIKEKVDEYSNYIMLENIIKGTNYTEPTELIQACNNISYFLFGVINS